MPVWGWVCIGLLVLAVVLAGLFYLFIMLPYEREQKRLQRDGETVVGLIFLANSSLYEATTDTGFEFAFVLFTRESHPSKVHLNYLRQVVEELQEFVPDENDPDESKLAWALSTQRTIGDVLRVPDRITGGREVYFSTPNIKRRLLPQGMLTEDYIYLRVIPEGRHRASEMIEYPDTAHKGG